MIRPLVECVPNFSEGRRPDVINTIVQSIRRAGAVHILDVSTDADHNRTVVTFAGTPDEVEKSAFAGIKTATGLINMDEHQGVHPRFGATDVVPFVPLRDVQMEVCIAMAQRLGERVGQELKLPVYLYESAATRQDRRNLAKIRSTKFQYEQLKTAIETDPNLTPDFGPAMLGPAGAIIIGARQALIAFNVFLSTDDVTIAQHIARAIRASNGGLAYVKAAGFLVDGRAQVSMNLTDYQQTPVFRVVEMIRREAQRYGVYITSSELIGLAPQHSFTDAAEWYMQLKDFSSDQLLEIRIAQAEAEAANTPLAQTEPPVTNEATSLMPNIMVSDQVYRPSAFVDEVAKDKALPGGGSVAALAGALAAALVQMVAGLTLKKQRYAEHHETMADIIQRADSLRTRLLDNVARDADAFRALMETVRLPEDDPNRVNLLVQKTFDAAAIPLSVCQQSLEILEIAAQVIEHGNYNAISDAVVGVHMANAAIASALFTLKINLVGFESHEQAIAMQEQANRILQMAQVLRDNVLQQAIVRTGLT